MNKYILVLGWFVFLLFGRYDNSITCLVGYTVCEFIESKLKE